MKKIGEYSFSFTGLKEISLNEGLEVIENSGFPTELKEVVIPRSVQEINTFAFEENTKLYVYADSYAEEFAKSLKEEKGYENLEYEVIE